MTPLRRKMIDDMQLAGLSLATQQTYQAAIYRLAKFYGRAPELLSEEQVESYLRDLVVRRKVARGTFQTSRYAIRFLFGNTLGLEWALLKKKCAYRIRSACRLSCHRSPCRGC